jgi:hypothetical protein
MSHNIAAFVLGLQSAYEGEQAGPHFDRQAFYQLSHSASPWVFLVLFLLLQCFLSAKQVVCHRALPQPGLFLLEGNLVVDQIFKYTISLDQKFNFCLPI